MADFIDLQVTITGFQGRPTTLFSSYEIKSKMLFIAKDEKLRTERFRDCLVVSNDPSISHDKLFTIAELKDAIEAYNNFRNTYSTDGKNIRLQINEKAQSCSPAGSVQIEGYDTNGPKYGVNEAISCSQIAALVTCLAASKIDTVEQSCSLTDQLDEALQYNDGMIFTV